MIALFLIERLYPDRAPPPLEQIDPDPAIFRPARMFRIDQLIGTEFIQQPEILEREKLAMNEPVLPDDQSRIMPQMIEASGNPFGAEPLHARLQPQRLIAGNRRSSAARRQRAGWVHS